MVPPIEAEGTVEECVSFLRDLSRLEPSLSTTSDADAGKPPVESGGPGLRADASPPAEMVVEELPEVLGVQFATTPYYAESPKPGKGQARCGYCHRRFPNKAALLEHRQEAHPTKKTRAKPGPRPKKEWVIPKRNRASADPEGRPYACPDCDLRFTRPQGLTRHRNQQHAGPAKPAPKAVTPPLPKRRGKLPEQLTMNQLVRIFSAYVQGADVRAVALEENVPGTDLVVAVVSEMTRQLGGIRSDGVPPGPSVVKQWNVMGPEAREELVMKALDRPRATGTRSPRGSGTEPSAATSTAAR